MYDKKIMNYLNLWFFCLYYNVTKILNYDKRIYFYSWFARMW